MNIKELNIKRFWSKVDKTGTCWLWTACLNSAGYGQFWVKDRIVYAHRIAYELLVGPIPVGLELDHLCRSPACVNPAHLEPVTHKENIQRGHVQNNGAHNKNKTHCPEGHPYSKKNTYVMKNGGRMCRACHQVSLRKYRSKL